MTRTILAVFVAAAFAGGVQAQGRARAAAEAAEFLFGRFGTKAGRSVPELAGRLETLAGKYGDDAIRAARSGGPSACHLIEAAGVDGGKAVKVLLAHGELGASRVLSRPAAMQQFVLHGEEAATALVRHPGVAEPLIERGGAQAVKALGAVEARNGRRLSMLLDGELSAAGRHPDVLKVVAAHGDKAVNFMWEHRTTLAGAAALTAFLANPEPYLNGTKNLMEASGEAVVKPVVSGLTTLLVWAGVLLTGLIVGAGALVWKFGPPKPETIKAALTLIGK